MVNVPIEQSQSVADVIQRSVLSLQEDVTAYVEAVLADRLKELTELRQELDSSNRFNDYFRKLDMDSAREREELRAQVRALKDAVLTQDRRVVCLIDGDGYIFSRSLITQGQEGGRLAAAKLSESIRDFIRSDGTQIYVYVFIHKQGLTNILRRCGLEAVARHLEEFMIGFNQSTERFIFVDVGSGKEAVDSKIRAYLEDEAKITQTTKIIFGGCHDNGYTNTLRSLITAGHGNKLVLLEGYKTMAAGYGILPVQSLAIPELFEPEKLEDQAVYHRAISPNVPLSTPAVPPGLGIETPTATSPILTSIPANTGPVSYRTALQTAGAGSRTQTWRGPPSPPRTRRIDPSKALSKQTPPPCNIFYLTNGQCKFKDSCAFAHDYLLTADQLDEVREFAKKSPCATMIRGDMCTYGEQCCYGHKCPMLGKCFFFKMGTCKFTAAGMHSE
ncbi:hypothetical protein BXZ70DRAFT_415569 [Cristinia sonorae]|uniref:C3H1-type domain-containing protein n=1 Tax=Cristinia sonorae TaxID=1940300 RepID=A0A8K0XTR0_9AGAR|nr:hypothetical protein BXZ70DRAFT_415569 [Cristinia sonorae]